VWIKEGDKWKPAFLTNKELFEPQVIYFGLYNSPVSGTVHTGVEVRRMDSEMSRLAEQSWLQLMCCAVCLPRGCNFR